MKIIVLLALVAVCSAAPQLGGLGSLGGLFSGVGGGSGSGGGSNDGGSNSGGSPPSSGSGSNHPTNDDGCSIGCPVGWTKWFGSDHCYLLPSQPATLRTFWDWNEACKKTDNTSYLAVSSNLVEQLIGSAIAIEYAPSWGVYLTNAYFWLGGYTKGGKWHFLDGTDESSNILFIGAAIASTFDMKDGYCLGADAKTLGLWQTYPCDEPRGTAFCEMKQKRVCGPQGGILPISPIDINAENIKSLFPTMYQIPYLSQILGAAGLDGAFNSIQCVGGLFSTCPAGGGSSSSPSQGQVLADDKCNFGCPAGWYSWDTANNHSSPSPTTPCYLLPPHDKQSWTSGSKTTPVSFPDAQALCKSAHGSSYVMVINSLLELATTKALLKKLRWDAANPSARLWLGERVDSNAWRYEDRSEENGNLVMSLANPKSRVTFNNGKCLAADLSDGGHWDEFDCNQAIGLYFCELPKQRYCNGQKGAGNFIDSSRAQIKSTDMTKGGLTALFGEENVNRAPFLDEVLQGKGQGPPINPASVGDSWGKKFFSAPGIAYVMCVMEGGGEWQLLQINGVAATIYGKWIDVQCTGAKTGFQASSTSVLSSWSRCYNKGYELAMPALQSFFGDGLVSKIAVNFASWTPFVVDTKVPAYYARPSIIGGLGSLGIAPIEKYKGGTIGSC